MDERYNVWTLINDVTNDRVPVASDVSMVEVDRIEFEFTAMGCHEDLIIELVE